MSNEYIHKNFLAKLFSLVFCGVLQYFNLFINKKQRKMKRIHGLAFLLFFLYQLQNVNFVFGLECYVCANQTGNTEKCLNTIKTCEPGEDVCFTEIRWGSTPYWSQGALKQYYVSKRCMSKTMCQKIRKRYMPYCTHIWYEDWTCSECCQGDRCNYYIISGSDKSSRAVNLILAVGVSILLFLNFS